MRPAADNIVVCPPYTIEKEHIDRIVDVVGEAIRKFAAQHATYSRTWGSPELGRQRRFGGSTGKLRPLRP